MICQSNKDVSVDEHQEGPHENGNEKQNVAGQNNYPNGTNLVSKSPDSSSRRRSSDLVCEVNPLDLADKLEHLLPDCLLDNLRDSEKNPRELAECRTIDSKETKLENIAQLSAQQDQFILDLLLT